MQQRWNLRRCEKQKRLISKLDYLPAELIQLILLYLPVKSLFRFSTVSKLWNSIIFRPEFAQSYRGREMIVFKLLSSDFGYKALVCPLSSISSDNPADKATSFDCPFQFPGAYVASCGSLWCVEFEKSLLLYNPSIHTYRKLPNPEFEEVPIGSTVSGSLNPVFVYGLGYDSVCDDYKILKIHKERYVESEMYSLRSNCWRKLESQPPQYSDFVSLKGLFVNGAFRWLILRLLWNGNGKRYCKNVILSFDLSEDKFGEMELPELPKAFAMSQFLDMILFGGKLRVYLNYECRFSVWVMEDYESKLWTKELEFDYGQMPPLCYSYLKPFYFYDSLGNLVRAVTSSNDMDKMFIYKEGFSTLVEKNFGSNGFGLLDSFTYVESFVSPLALEI